MSSTKSGIMFSDADGTPLLVVNISKDMVGFDELVKLLPQVQEHVE